MHHGVPDLLLHVRRDDARRLVRLDAAFRLVQLTSTNSGGAWTATHNGIAGYRLQFSDGTYDGLPVQAIVQGADKAYGPSNEVGVQFTMPAGPTYNVRGAAFFVQQAGSPTGNVIYKLYQNGAYVATTLGVAPGDPFASSGYGYVPDYFSSDITLNPGDVVTLTLADSATDTSSNYFLHRCEYQFATDVNTQALMPFEGTLKKVTTTNGSSGSPTFATTATSIFPFALLLDTAGEFAVTGAGVPRIGPDLIGGICG